MNVEQINSLGKMELRAACKAVGIKYGSLNNDGMKAALIAHYAEPTDTDGDQTEHAPEVDTGGELDAGASMDQAPAEQPQDQGPAEQAVETTMTEPATETPAAEPRKGIKIQKDRVTQNGVTHPSEGGPVCAVWDALDAMRDADDGKTPSAKALRSVGEREGWNRHTTMVQYYQWRKFHGISGRQ